MPRESQRLFPLDEKDRKDLAQCFCLALRNTQVYGTQHSVSATSISALFDKLVHVLDRYPEVEWSLVEGKLLLNGQPAALRTADELLGPRMKASSMETFSFLDTLKRPELSRFLTFLGTGKDPSPDGAAFNGIRIAASVYAKISRADLDDAVGSGGGDAGQGDDGSGHGQGEARAAQASGIKQYDLDSMLGGGAGGGGGRTGGTGIDTFAMSHQVAGFLAQKRIVDEQRRGMISLIQQCAGDVRLLASLQENFISAGGEAAEWSWLCGSAGIRMQPGQGALRSGDAQIRELMEEVESLRSRCAEGVLDASTVSEELGRIRGTLDGLMETIHVQTETLVDKVHADRDHVARLEQDARDSGSVLHLSREELLDSLAEINQELAQPLTVSTALIEMLSSGRMGVVDIEQQELLDVASSSLERLETVVRYLQRLSGTPQCLSPDHELLSEVYAKPVSGVDASV